MPHHHSIFRSLNAGKKDSLACSFRRDLRKGFESLEARQLLAADLLFADSFEGSGNSNNWAGNWVQDSQNDWFRSSQRASDGGLSAEVDGYAADATLSLANPIDLSGYQSSQLTFDWYIESGFDHNEFLALDISTNNGASWQNDVRRLDGNVDAENTWHSETVDLTPFHSAQLLVRFRSVVSSSSEDANVDNVRLVGVPIAAEPLGLVSHWKGDGNAADTLGRNDGVLVSGAGYASGQVNSAFAFDGIDDRLIVPDSPSLRLTGSMTIEGWVRVDSLPTSGHGTILFRGDDRGGLDPYSLHVTSQGEFRFAVNSLSDADGVSTAAPLGAFVHLVATLDDATGEMKLYLNGVLRAQKTTNVRPFGALDPNSNPGVGIGNHGGYPATPHNFPFHGRIDELKLHDVALSESEVLANFTATQGDLLPSVSIADATTLEGGTHYQFLDNFIAPASGGLKEARGIEYGPDGNLYVSRESFHTDPVQQGYIQRYDAVTGAFIDIFATHPEMNGAKDVEFGPDGNLYVPNNFGDNVYRFNGITGEFIDVFIPAGVGGLDTPRSLIFGPDGNGDGNADMYIASAKTNSILRYDGVSGAFIDDFVSSGSGGLNSPTALVFGPDGNLYVASGAHADFYNSILRYDGNTGEFLDVFVQAGSGGLTLAPTAGVIFGPDVNDDALPDMYVSNGGGDEVLIYSGTDGTFLQTFITAGLGGLDDPKGLLFDHDGNLLVISNGDHSVRRYGAASQAAFTVNLSAPSPVPVTVDFATSDLTAIAGSDYVATSGTLFFEPGVTSLTIAVPTLDDTIPESSETFAVTLLSAVGATLADTQGVGTIVDNDLSQPPQAANNAYVVAEDMVLSITAPGVLANDSDPEGDPLTATLLTAPAYGSLSLNADGSFAYIPNGNFYGTDSFTYRAHDGGSFSSAATVSLTITPVNDAPQPQADQYAATQDTPLSIDSSSGVLANDFDVDGDALSALDWTGASSQGGQVVLNSDGSFSYTPPAGFSGTDTFHYTLTDGSQQSGPVTVSLDVAPAISNAIYVYDIRFESRKDGRDWRAVFEIRSDSNSDGQGGSNDSRASGVAIRVEFAGRTYTGTTDSNGIFRTSWIRHPGSGTYANVVDLALVDFRWDPLLMDLEDDSDGDGRPDAAL